MLPCIAMHCRAKQAEEQRGVQEALKQQLQAAQAAQREEQVDSRQGWQAWDGHGCLLRTINLQ